MSDKLFKELLLNVKGYIKDEKQIRMITNAYLCADFLHSGQKRKSGEEYIIHPISVALILSRVYADADTISAALLHDVIEDTKDFVITDKDIATIFNETVSKLVFGVTKIKKLDFKSREEEVATNNRKIIMSLNDDIRIIIIKLADRLHNMQTLNYLRPFKQKENALETMEIYVPLAYYIGAYELKSELEELSFKYLKPSTYKRLESCRSKVAEEVSKIVQEMLVDLSTKLSDRGITHDITMRVKNTYGIYNKLIKTQNIENIHDLLSIKIMVENRRDCYTVLEIVHSNYPHLREKFKDYIASPKTNMYRSIHTTVNSYKGKNVQVQIKTFEMNEMDLLGLMSYFHKYGSDASLYMQKDLTTKFQIYKSLSELDEILSDNQEFIKHAKKELYTNKIFVSTPKGKIIELPTGSTPIDFAYRLNPEIGNKMVGAIVNGEAVALDYKLQNKDMVKIITNEIANPSLDWVEQADTVYAKKEISKFYSKKIKY